MLLYLVDPESSRTLICCKVYTRIGVAFYRGVEMVFKRVCKYVAYV